MATTGGPTGPGPYGGSTGGLVGGFGGGPAGAAAIAPPGGAPPTPATGIVTPEAVQLRFETANVGSRIVAELLDLGVLGALGTAILMVAAFVSGAIGSEVVIVIVALSLVLVLLVGYPVAMEVLWNGRTLGKAAMGLRVVTREGAPVRFRHAAIRAMLGLIEIFAFFGLPAVISILVSRREQRLGDLVAGTLVLRQRPGRRPTVPVAFGVPWGWEGWVAALDVSPLTAEQYGVVRAFLLRTGEMSAAARWQVGWELASMVAGRMGIPVPQGVPPELFLTGVAAAYQRRYAT